MKTQCTDAHLARQRRQRAHSGARGGKVGSRRGRSLASSASSFSGSGSEGLFEGGLQPPDDVLTDRLPFDDVVGGRHSPPEALVLTKLVGFRGSTLH